MSVCVRGRGWNLESRRHSHGKFLLTSLLVHAVGSPTQSVHTTNNPCCLVKRTNNGKRSLLIRLPGHLFIRTARGPSCWMIRSGNLRMIFGMNFLQAPKGKKTVKFVIDCAQPVEDSVLDVAMFEKYLQERIKIGGKTGQLSNNNVVITRDKTKLTIASPQELGFSKRQLKYLSKRYLKKQQLKDYLRVVASSKNSYILKYYNVDAGGEGDEE